MAASATNQATTTVQCSLSREVERIGDFCNTNLAQYFHCVIQSDPIPVNLSKYLIQFGSYLTNLLIKHLTAVINTVWISTSNPEEYFSFSKSSAIGIRF